MTIIEFLEARIAEDEREALDAPKMSDPYDAHRIAFTDAMRRRALAECAAKRAVVMSYLSCAGAHERTDIAKEFGVKLTVGGMVKGIELAVKHLTAIYADHPDHRQEWAL